ncbi:MAG: helix-turn-helix domain-containing protein [Rhizobiales bacterium]|nr:helix-turn-helix domain-containing protein [Hyphomicrobiales bacterium]
MHATRMAMLEKLESEPATVSQIAARMGVHPANLTRHMRILLAAGLVEVAETRDTGRNVEKYYRITASSFDVAPDADQLKAPHRVVLAFARSDLAAAIAALPDEETRTVHVQLVAARIAPEAVAEFKAELTKLAARFEAAETEGGEPYRLNLNLYPTEAPPPGSKGLRVKIKPKGKGTP